MLPLLVGSAQLFGAQVAYNQELTEDFIEAAGCGKTDEIRKLLKHRNVKGEFDIDVNVRDKRGFNALDLVASNGDCSTFYLLEDVCEQSYHLMRYALQGGNKDIIEKLYITAVASQNTVWLDELRECRFAVCLEFYPHS